MQKHKFELYSYWRSSCSWRLRWGMELKGLKYTLSPINLLKEENLSPKYLSINPLGYVPTLLINGVAFTESLAILEWLEENYPKPSLMPANPLERLRARQIALTIIAGVQPIQNLSVLKSVSGDKNIQQEFGRYHISRGLLACESHLQTTAGTFALGSEISIADLALIPQAYNALRFGLDLNNYPTIKGIYERARKTPACIKSSPEVQVDAQHSP